MVSVWAASGGRSTAIGAIAMWVFRCRRICDRYGVAMQPCRAEFTALMSSSTVIRLLRFVSNDGHPVAGADARRRLTPVTNSLTATRASWLQSPTHGPGVAVASGVVVAVGRPRYRSALHRRGWREPRRSCSKCLPR